MSSADSVLVGEFVVGLSRKELETGCLAESVTRVGFATIRILKTKEVFYFQSSRSSTIAASAGF
jgi:hypothetical protein